MKVRGAFNDNYVEYESRRGKGKNLSVKEYLYKIIRYLRDMINDHKAYLELQIQSRNEINLDNVKFSVQWNSISFLL